MSWSRGELKARAKAGLKTYYWYGVLVCFIAGILGAGTGGKISLGQSGNIGRQEIAEQSAGVSSNVDWTVLVGILFIMLAVFAVVWVIAMLLSTFLGNVVLVGKYSYFINSIYQGKSAGIERLFSAFGGGHYMNVVMTMFMKMLYTFLWSLLFVIPGIIKSYEYYMVPYLLAEYPDMDRKEVFRLSKEMMQGNKFKTWVLELSFIGWYILGTILCCIGQLFVNPYREATMAELYLTLKEQVIPSQPGTDEFAGSEASQSANFYY